MQCRDKRAFADKKDAQTALNARTKGRKVNRKGRRTGLKYYRCDVCGSYHLAKVKESDD